MEVSNFVALAKFFYLLDSFQFEVSIPCRVCVIIPNVYNNKYPNMKILLSADE